MNTITVETIVQKNIQDVWDMWTTPSHIEKWNYASEDWECPYAENDVTVHGRFLLRMSAKDGSASFDFTGTYTTVIPLVLIAYTMDDGREASVAFTKISETETKVTETFEPETENSHEMQYNGWNAILTNFKLYAEQH